MSLYCGKMNEVFSYKYLGYLDTFWLLAIFYKKNKLIPSFAQCQEKGKEGGTDKKPRRNRNFDSQPTSNYTDMGASWNNKYVLYLINQIILFSTLKIQI